MLWEPAIYEHKAALIGRSPAEVSRSAPLLTEALLKEYAVYGADLLTVGLDVYNVEAEACGATLTTPDARSCPDLAAPCWDIEALPGELDLPRIPEAGRFGVMLEAGQRVADRLRGRCRVRVAASGPVTLATRFVGMEALILGLALEDARAGRVLDFAQDLCLAWCAAIRRAGLEAIVFDSAAAPPILSPALYEAWVLPQHGAVMAQLERLGQGDRPLVVGGDTTPIAGMLAQTGASLLVCDFPAAARAYAGALPADRALAVRRNVRPAALLGPAAHLGPVVAAFVADLACLPSPIAGTGILPYDFDPACYHGFREQVTRQAGSVPA